MSKKVPFSYLMRVAHRYLGYFLAGIMMVYALSGIVLVYRDQEFLKKEVQYKEQFAKGMNEKQLAEQLRIKRFRVTKEENNKLYFKQGFYDVKTGQAEYTKKEYPYILDKMVSLHKAKSEDSMSPLNVFFGISLFFYVVSSFLMFSPKSDPFKKGLIFTTLGLVLALMLLFV